MVPMSYPHGLEMQQRSLLLKLVRQLRLTIKKHLSPVVPQLVLEATRTDFGGADIRQDDFGWDDTLTRTLQQIARDMMNPVRITTRQVQALGPRINNANREEWRRLIRGQYGVDPTADDPGRWAGLLERWANQNALLIQDIPDQVMRQIRDQSIEALRSGRAPRDLAGDIFEIMADRTDVSESRARLIARDQVAKLNGQFTRERQTDLGVTSYTWRTVGDERVRESHDAVDGMVFDWDNPPGTTDYNHPGEDYQCRCWAEPVLPEVLQFNAPLLELEAA